jgi:hypothetical protein
VQALQAPVVFGSEIGPTLNWNEPDVVFRFKVQDFAEPEPQVQFGVQAGSLVFEC